jgi:hypothetical protein
MKNNTFLVIPLFCAVVSGVVAWSFYRDLLELIALETLIKHTLVLEPRLPSQVFFHRLQIAGAFSLLGFLVALAAILTSRGKPRSYSLCILSLFTALSLVIAISTSWLMKARLASVAEFASEITAKDPSIQSVIRYSDIPFYRIAVYPSWIMILVIVFSLFRTYRGNPKIIKEANKAEMATPRKAPDQFGS